MKYFGIYFICQAYHDPMLKLSIMSEEELTHIFGDLDSYIPLHEGKSSWVLCAHWDLTSLLSPVVALLQFLFFCFHSRLTGKFGGSNKARWNSGADWAHPCEVGEFRAWLKLRLENI